MNYTLLPVMSLCCPYLYWQPVDSPPFVYSLTVVPSSLWLSLQKLKKLKYYKNKRLNHFFHNETTCSKSVLNK